MEARDSFCFPKKTKNPNPSPIEKRFGFSILAAGFPIDIPTGWEPQRNLVVRALRVAFADFSAAPWQGFEKSERGPNNSSLFQPLAAVVVVAVQVLFRTEKEKPVHIVYWFFLVRVVIQHFLKTIVVQFVFEVIG